MRDRTEIFAPAGAPHARSKQAHRFCCAVTSLCESIIRERLLECRLGGCPLRAHQEALGPSHCIEPRRYRFIVKRYRDFPKRGMLLAREPILLQPRAKLTSWPPASRSLATALSEGALARGLLARTARSRIDRPTNRMQQIILVRRTGRSSR